MKILYVAHYIDTTNPMNIGSFAEANVFMDNLRFLTSNYDHVYIKKILRFDDLKNFVNHEINKSMNGTFIFYFNGSGHQEQNISQKEYLNQVKSIIFKPDPDTVEEIKNKEILDLINKVEFKNIKFNLILDSCNTGQFLNQAKDYYEVPILVLTATGPNAEINSSFLTHFLNILFFGICKMFLTIKSFEVLFNARFAVRKKGKSRPQLYYNKKYKTNQILFN